MLSSLLMSVVLSCSVQAQMASATAQVHPVADAYEGWRLGMQAYSFRKFTFFEAVEKTESLGLSWIEVYPDQTVGKDNPNIKFTADMPAEVRQQVKHRLAQGRVKLVNYGVIALPNDEAQCRKVFDFAKDMGIETIVSEPPEEAFDLLDKLCEEYKIKVAIHNHPQPSHYWNPDTVLAACKGHSKWIGSCADIGHWMRSGVNPLEAVKKLEGRLVSLHIKDLNDFGSRKAHDVVWGTGAANVKAILGEIHRQGFKGVFSIEYEYNWDNSVPEIRQCVQYFNEVAGELKPGGWRDLVAEDLSNCTFRQGSWAVQDGVLTKTGGPKDRNDIWTKETYGDFVLDVEFKVVEKTNSGIFFRTANIRDPVQTGIEIQVFDSFGREKPGNHDCGAVYDCVAPTKNMVRKPGEWNRCTITAKANRIYVAMNGEPIIDMDLNLWTEPHKNPDGSANKYNTAYRDMARIGHIGFQDHGHQVWYRNMKIRSL
jgi:sugar phosphate isomerase/epimerase